jgi:threonylcarbamoyladenosine tRNA methylthiotransferase MtaB
MDGTTLSCAPRIVSLGCRLNGAEGEAMRKLAASAGLERVVIINSCAVTNEAVRQTRQEIRRARRADPDARIVVTGCAAQLDPDAFAAMGEVDAVLGNAEKLDASHWRRLAGATAPSAAVSDIMAMRETAPHLIDGYGDRARAFLQVQNGCDHRCTFCIIPFGRGPSRSTPLADVVDQARRLVASGHRELVLTGVDITSWGADLEGAPRLGALVGAILDGAPDLFRLRLSSVDVAEIDDALFDRIAHDARLAPHLHLSLQAGDDMILKRMKRRHARADAIAFCDRARAARPDIGFGADLIAGFPTETDAMFARTLALIDDADISFAHVFPYSPRAGTPAAKMPAVAPAIIAERARMLRERGEARLAARAAGKVGAVEWAVIESGGRARLGDFCAVDIGPGATAGEVRRVRIERAEGGRLYGAMATE